MAETNKIIDFYHHDVSMLESLPKFGHSKLLGSIKSKQCCAWIVAKMLTLKLLGSLKRRKCCNSVWQHMLMSFPNTGH